MPSSFAWLDYSEHEKRKMLDVINLFRERDTRDELGIGTVRDAFADMLFPGTSTIQTRARYFLFIPWIYLDLERRRVKSDKIADAARREETKLIYSLLAGGETEGVIGVDAKERLKRLPSNIYWQGLGEWGIRLNMDSQDGYHRHLDSFYASLTRARCNDDREPVEGHISRNWHSGIPDRPAELLAKTQFTLSLVEAEYLRERALSRAQDSLLAFLVDEGRGLARVNFPWEIPHFINGKLPEHIQEILLNARNFSETIHGAALLYNLLLAEKVGNRENEGALIEEYRDNLNCWGTVIRARETELKAWDRKNRFWEIVKAQNPRVPIQTKRFIDTWFDMVFAPNATSKIADNPQARVLIHTRERFLKRGQARLDNQRALEQWSGAAGTAQLSYRWQRPVQTIISDIVKGLKA